jgi:hypothetical protein
MDFTTRYGSQLVLFLIEMKKLFMDEWSGEPDRVQLRAMKGVLQSTVWGIHVVLAKLNIAEPEDSA